MSFNAFRVIIFALVNGICIYSILAKKKFSRMQKMYFIFAAIGTIVYSGISTLYNNLCEEFFIPFLLYMIFFTWGFHVAFKTKFVFGRKSISHLPEESNSTSLTQKMLGKQFLIFCVFCFYAYYIVQFIYPEIRISELFNFKLSIVNIFAKRNAMRGNFIYQLFYYIQMASFGFYMIYLYRIIREGHLIKAVLLILLWMYLSAAVSSYMARTTFLVYAAFLIILICSAKDEYFGVNKKVITTGIVFILAAIPMLVAYESIRLGGNSQLLGLFDSLERLFKSETGYGRYYKFCTSLTDIKVLVTYVIWLLTMPLPSAIFSFKNKLKLTNVYFSEAYTGIAYGEARYNTLLPSLLGEGIMLFGKYFAFIQGFLLGFFLCKFAKSLEKNKDLEVLNLYFAVSTFLLGRGATASVLPLMINSMVFYLICVFILKSVNRKK